MDPVEGQIGISSLAGDGLGPIFATPNAMCRRAPTDPTATIFLSERIHRMNSGSVVQRGLRAIPFVALVLALAAGCDTAPGPEDASLRPPVVSDFTWAPGVVIVEELPEQDVQGGIASVTITAQVTARDPDGDLARVSWIVRGPAAGSSELDGGDMTPLGGGRYSMEETVGFQTAVPGRHTLLVYAVDRSGRLGNDVRGVIDVQASGTPPEITGVEMPSSVVRPAVGEPPVPVVIVVSAEDPDGLANILRVEMRVDGGAPLSLCDDGGEGACNPALSQASSGDEVDGDGRFTVTLQVESTNAAGLRTLTFEAVDRSGLRSEAVQRTLDIQ